MKEDNLEGPAEEGAIGMEDVLEDVPERFERGTQIKVRVV